MLLAARGSIDLARLTVISADCYLRPGEVLDLSTSSEVQASPGLGRPYSTVSLLMHPDSLARASMVGLFDDSVLCDLASRPYIGLLLVDAKKKTPPGQRLTNRSI